MTWISIEDVRAAKICTRGLREYARVRGLDFREFVRRGGVDSESLPQEEIVMKIREIANGRRTERI